MEIINMIAGWVWGLPLIIMLLATGVYLTFKLGFIQIKGLWQGVELVSGKYSDPKHKGHLTYFQSMSTALSATIGTGNIAGVATAIYFGGPGALFWMWVTAFFGMAIKFTSSTLAVLFRDESGSEIKGGPMYYIEHGFRKVFGWDMKWLAIFFALSTAVAAFGIGNMVQANSVADAFSGFFGDAGDFNVFIIKLIIGLVMAVLAGMVIIGGIKRIGAVASYIVPFMSVIYITGGIIILIMNADLLSSAFASVFKAAFTGEAAKGGLFGSAVMYTIRMGVARGIFSNEAGLGTEAMAYSVSKTDNPVRTGLVSMIGPVIDTLIVCTITGLVIVISGAHLATDLNGASLTAEAFSMGLAGAGKVIVSFGLMFFAFSTIIAWYYYGEKGIEYLAGRGVIPFYKVLWVILIPIGAITQLKLVWNISDIFNGLMALPNLIALLFLAGVVLNMKDKYFKCETRSAKRGSKNVLSR